MPTPYDLKRAGEIFSPQLIYYRDRIVKNIEQSVAIAGAPGRLWPHVKSHKSPDMVRLQMAMGITRFKCATIAEAEMLGLCGAPDVLLAYPQVGPTIARFLRLTETFPETRFWALGDDFGQMTHLGEAATARGIIVPTLVDLDMGMRRTGHPPENAVAFFARCAAVKGVTLQGLHCYDGHIHMADSRERQASADRMHETIRTVRAELNARNLDAPVVVWGGAPTFAAHAVHAGTEAGSYFSPGTNFLWDMGYGSSYPETGFVHAAVVMTRVVSHPGPDLFTLDLGHKGLAADPKGQRGFIAGLEEAEPVNQSEEHWVFRAPPPLRPPLGAELYVIPTHICPTSALYPFALVAEGGEIVNRWEITARVRQLSI